MAVSRIHPWNLHFSNSHLFNTFSALGFNEHILPKRVHPNLLPNTAKSIDATNEPTYTKRSSSIAFIVKSASNCAPDQRSLISNGDSDDESERLRSNSMSNSVSLIVFAFYCYSFQSHWWIQCSLSKLSFVTLEQKRLLQYLTHNKYFSLSMWEFIANIGDIDGRKSSIEDRIEQLKKQLG